MSRRTSVAVLLALVLVAGCGSDSKPDASAAPERVVRIGVLAPLEAGLTDFGAGIRNSVQLAVDQANEAGAVPGWTIEVVATDDSSDPVVGAKGAAALVADPTVLGVVGTYNSGVAVAALPALSDAHLALVSPGNTLADLTLPERTYDNYFRLVASDAQQGPFLAQRAYDGLHARTVAVVSETKAVSKGLADSFAAAFTAAGGAVPVRVVVPDGATDFAPFLAQALPAAPDLVFFGGEYPVAAALRRAATAAGFTKPLLGGDGIKDPAYITAAGAPSEGDVASSVGQPVADMKTAASFLTAYDKAGFDEPASDFGPFAYDAANVVIAAIAEALAGATSIASGARASVVAGVQATESTGATGALAFDDHGDTTHRLFTLYRVTGGTWVPVS